MAIRLKNRQKRVATTSSRRKKQTLTITHNVNAIHWD